MQYLVKIVTTRVVQIDLGEEDIKFGEDDLEETVIGFALEGMEGWISDSEVRTLQDERVISVERE